MLVTLAGIMMVPATSFRVKAWSSIVVIVLGSLSEVYFASEVFRNPAAAIVVTVKVLVSPSLKVWGIVPGMVNLEVVKALSAFTLTFVPDITS